MSCRADKQRVAIARALVTHPSVLLLDEPLAALDAKLREELQIELINLQKEVGITFVYVTHDQTEALALSHRIAVMNKGRVEQLDEPAALYSFPNSRFVADFIGTCNLLEGPIRGTSDGMLSVDVAGLGAIQGSAPKPAGSVSDGAIALRPEKIRISAASMVETAPNRFRGTVTDMLFLGDVTVYNVTTAGGRKLEALLANSGAGRRRLFNVGDHVEVSWAADAGHLIIEGGRA